MGQSVEISHLGKYLHRSKVKYESRLRELNDSLPDNEKMSEAVINDIVQSRLKDELSAGVQTIQYQINTLMTTNGQSPFVTLFMYIRPEEEYKEEVAMIIEEILNQRIKGIKNEAGVYITPAFPKLVYVLDENNNLSGGEYDYLTELAIQCTAKRMYPDYISAKKMKENYQGNVFSPMGCVDGKEVVSYKFNGQFYTEAFDRLWNKMASYYPVKEQDPGNSDYLYIDTPGLEVYDNKASRFVENRRIIRNRNSQWLRIKFRNGRVLTCTYDHPLETENRGVVQAKNLKEDDIVAFDKGFPVDGSIPYNVDKAWMLGALLCDSSYNETVCLSIAKTGEDEIEEAFVKLVEKYYHLPTRVKVHERGVKGCYKDLIVMSDGTQSYPRFRNELISLFGGVRKLDRQIPNEVFSWSRDARLSFMGGMIDADGYINTSLRMARIQIGSTNKELALQEMLLAQSLGYRASVYVDHYTMRNDNVRYFVEFAPDNLDLAPYIKCKKKSDKLYLGVNERKNLSISETDGGSVSDIIELEYEDYSYDVTTESEHFTVSGIYSHNCRSFLAPWKDENGEYKFEGRLTTKVEPSVNCVNELITRCA